MQKFVISHPHNIWYVYVYICIQKNEIKKQKHKLQDPLFLKEKQQKRNKIEIILKL